MYCLLLISGAGRNFLATFSTTSSKTNKLFRMPLAIGIAARVSLYFPYWWPCLLLSWILYLGHPVRPWDPIRLSVDKKEAGAKSWQLISYRYQTYSLKISGVIPPPTWLYDLHRKIVTFILNSETPATLESQISYRWVLLYQRQSNFTLHVTFFLLTH